MRDNIEQKIRLLQKQKASLAEDVLGKERFAQSLTLDDLRFLFADEEAETNGGRGRF
jgi:SNF2 family DNA or RNA helicase